MLDQSGRPVPNARVFVDSSSEKLGLTDLYAKDGGNLFNSRVETNEQGEFEITHPFERYSLTVVCDEGYGEAEGVSSMIEIASDAAGPGPHRPLRRVDPHALHHRQVDDQTVIDAAEPRSVVAASANGDRQLVVAPEIHGGDHVGRIQAANDQKTAESLGR